MQMHAVQGRCQTHCNAFWSSETKGPEATKPILRHSRSQHDLKTVVRSNIPPEMAEK